MKLDDLKAAADSLKADLADVATKLSVVVSNEAVQLAMIADLKARIAQGTITEADLDPLAASLAEDKSVIAQLRAALAPISTPLAPDTSTGGTNQPPPPDQGQV